MSTDAIMGVDAAKHGLGVALVGLDTTPLMADYYRCDGEGMLEEQVRRALDAVPLDGITIRSCITEMVAGGRNVRSMLIVERAASAAAGILVERYPSATHFRCTPSHWKIATLGRGKGNANKAAVMNAARLFAPELITADSRSDVADSLMIALSEAVIINDPNNGVFSGDLRPLADRPNGAVPQNPEQMELG